MRRAGRVVGTGMAAAWLSIVSGCASSPGWTWRNRQRHSLEAAAQSSQAMALSQEAQTAIDRHDEAAARGLLEELVTVAPKSAEAHQRLGKVLQTEGRFVEAEAAYRKALELDPEYAAAQTGLGSIAAMMARPDEAIEEFDAAIDISPHQSDAHFFRAQALETLGKTDDALAGYFRALEFDPNSSKIQLRIATLLIARDEPDQALVRLDPVVQQNPDDAEARHQRGRAHLALHHPKLAVDDLKIAALKLPGQADVHYHLALALEAEKDTNGAIASANRALQIAPDYAEAKALRGKLVR